MANLTATHEISPFAAILWCFYPFAALVLFELIMRASDGDDDDDQGGGLMSPVYQGT